jgi:hypothetical protein
MAKPSIAAAPYPSARGGTPVAGDDGARLGHCHFPEREHFDIGPLVETVEIAVTEHAAATGGIFERKTVAIERRLAGGGQGHALEARPRKVLHPRRVRGRRIDRHHLVPGPRRLPPLVQLHAGVAALAHPFGEEARDRPVPAVAVHHDDAAKARPIQAFENVADQRDVRRELQAHGARKIDEVRRHPVRHHREDRNGERLRGFDRDPLGEDHVDAEAEIAVLLDAADRQDAAIIVTDPVFDLHPVHAGNAHLVISFVCRASITDPAAGSTPPVSVCDNTAARYP